jgi:hypothetical protein
MVRPPIGSSDKRIVPSASVDALLAAATQVHPKGAAILRPGGLVSDPVSAIYLGLALMFGTTGPPHILMRFYAVRDAQRVSGMSVQRLVRRYPPGVELVARDGASAAS